ncbi:MAG: hypothetical protein IIY84_02035, partial [Eubacterium sp.]|nr:hypothetical protein [Eubacterium sp.]
MKPKAKRKLVPVPAEPKFSSGFYSSLTLHTLTAVAALWMIFLLATDRIKVEEGQEGALTLLLVLAITTAIVYLCSVVTLLRQLCLGHPWVYDGDGYRDTYAGGYFLWMHLILPVQYIPEEAILFVRVDEVGRGRQPIWERVVHIDPKRVEGISFARDLA